MKISSLQDSEQQRLEVLYRYQILDSEEESDFNNIVQLAAELCGTSIALINFLDEHRQWFKAKIGLDIQETHRDFAICSHTIQQNDLMTVYDASLDERFSDNPFVIGEPHIRFYSGLPLITNEGYKLGTLCVLDNETKNISEAQSNCLRILAKQVINLLDLRVKNIELNTQAKEIHETKESLERAEELAGLGIWHLEIGTGKRYWSKQMFRLFGLKETDKVPEFDEYLKMFHPQDQPIVKECTLKMQQGDLPDLKVLRTNPEILPLRYLLPATRCIKNSTGTPVSFECTFLDITQQKITESSLVESENRFRTIFQLDPDCIKILGPKCELLDINPGGLSILESESKDNVIGSSFLELIQPDYQEAFNNLMRDVFDGKSGSLEFELISLKGTKRWIETNAVPFRNADGEIVSLLGVAHDTTERRKNEDLLRKAEERYRSIFENALDGIYQTTSEGRFITANPAMAKIFGYESAEQLLKHVTDVGEQLYKNPEARLQVVELLKKKGEIVDYEIETIKRSGEVIWVLANIRCFYNNENEVTYFEGTLKDITEQKKAQIEIIKEKEFADSFINSLPGVFYMYNSEGRYLRWNLKLESITGYSSDELVSMHPSELIEEGEERDLVVSRISEVFLKGYAEIETDLLLKNGKKIPYYFNGWKIRYNNEDCLIGVGIDISSRKLAEQELRNSENKIKAFFRSTPDASILLDEQFKILDFNHTANQLAENTFGSSLKQGDSFIELCPIDLQNNISQFLASALQGNTEQHQFYLHDTKTLKNTWWLGVFMAAYDNDGKVFGVIVNLTNINEIKEAKLNLKKQNEELQKTNLELDHFVYSVSHDLRAPLTTILGLINISEMENPSPSLKSYLEMMRGSVNRMDRFIKDILNYSQNARIQIVPQKIDFQSLIDESIADLKLNSGADRLQLDLTINSSETFLSDPTRIGILFNNLLSNSIKYQDFKKAKLSVSITISISAIEAHIVFSDNGLGIEGDQIEKIFNMFYRASHSSVGAGLGLYIVKETINRLKGSIKVNSILDQSTTFEIVIPNSKSKRKNT
jgi:PAS domain S-box-containing protein